MAVPRASRSLEYLLGAVAAVLLGACLQEAPEDTAHLRVVAVRAEPPTGTPGGAGSAPPGTPPR